MDVDAEVPDSVELVQMSRKELFLSIRSDLHNQINDILQRIEDLLAKKFRSCYRLPKQDKERLRRLIYQFRGKWSKAHRSQPTFLKSFHNWLEAPLVFEKTSIPEKEDDVLWTPPSAASGSTKKKRGHKEKTLSGEEALTVMTKLKLSRPQYEGLRAVSYEHNCQLFPPYAAVLEAQK
ncbi:uncharacterized protein LOC143213085 [Lasioglossum baleicum]|uniref:uncharacterized protein LOC143213085 n=1 Tax=Lasioglossum baleicum TaxID=434251 RepID=UPI003FCECFF5